MFVAKSFLGNLHRHLAIFYWSHCCYVTDKLFLAILGFISGRTYIYSIKVNDLNAVIHLLFFVSSDCHALTNPADFLRKNFLSSTGLEPLRLAWRISHEDRLHPADPSGLFLLCWYFIIDPNLLIISSDDPLHLGNFQNHLNLLGRNWLWRLDCHCL